MIIAAIHRDWVRPQGNYDESDSFTGLRPSEADRVARVGL